MIFTYSFTIDGYDVTYYYSIFPSCYCVGRLFSINNYEIANNWRFTLFYLTLLLGHFTVGLFSAEIFYCWAIFCRNILPLDCFLQKYFTARLFSAETLYCWVISYSMFFNRADMSAVRIVYGLLLSVSI